MSLLFLLLGVFSQAVMGVIITQGPYDGTDVGDVDIFVTEGAKLGNPAKETAWVNSLPEVQVELIFVSKIEPVDYFLTDTANVYAFALGDPIEGDFEEYFLIKNARRVALFRNIDELDWGVFDATRLSGAMNLPSEDFEISHVTRFVPEPSTLALLGLGLIGIYVVRRRDIGAGV
jgi:hypothetical protein